MRMRAAHSAAMSLWNESRLTLRLAVPLMIGQLSQMLLGVADTVMIGRLGVTELAALTFATSLFHLPLVFGIGVLTAVSVFTSNRRGAGDAAGVRQSCRDGLVLGILLGTALFALSLPVAANLHWFGQPAEVSGRTPAYLRIVMLSLVPALASIALKNHADALNRPWPPFWIFLGGVLLNILLNWVMIFGKLGCPALGFEGAAWATLISRTAILLGMMAWLRCARGLHDWIPRRWCRGCRRGQIMAMLAIGLPASAQMIFEVSAFSVAALLMGRFGPDAMAAHQIAVTLAATAFMVPLGLSMALTVRFGEAHGAGEHHRLRPMAISGWLCVVACALLAASVLFLTAGPMAAAFTGDPAVIRLATSLLVIVAMFQVFDGLQVASLGMLRGMRDTRVPAVIGFISYWICGMPLAAVLAFGLGLEARGVWWGLAAGLAVACFTLGPRLWRRCAPMKN
jgi:MATE family multidrug resistance protein